MKTGTASAKHPEGRVTVHAYGRELRISRAPDAPDIYFITDAETGEQTKSLSDDVLRDATQFAEAVVLRLLRAGSHRVTPARTPLALSIPQVHLLRGLTQFARNVTASSATRESLDQIEGVLNRALQEWGAP